MRRRLCPLLTTSLSILSVFGIYTVLWGPKRTVSHSRYSLWEFSSNTYTPPSLPPLPHPPNKRQSVNLTDEINTYHLNLTQFQYELPYLQSYTCSLILSPREEPEETASQKLLILAIKTHPKSVNRRDALRETWAKEWKIGKYRIRPIFLMATTGKRGQMEMVKYENKVYEDILQWDFMEEHQNLSLKERCFLEWLNDHIPSVNFVFKGDDDVYVNPPALVKYIEEHGSSPYTIHGAVQNHSVVLRYSKYKVTGTLFPYGRYPAFVSGGGFLYPGTCVKPLYEVSQKIPTFPLDDVYFGMLALAANLTLFRDNRFYVFGVDYTPCNFKEALMVHSLSPERLLEVWEEVNNATCKPSTPSPMASRGQS
ncbi:UDP-GlcNAc:betaGal beta-1,3-N-acetylglucosaminyltransferase 7-like [Rhinophrynus dorsalis]